MIKSSNKVSSVGCRLKSIPVCVYVDCKKVVLLCTLGQDISVSLFVCPFIFHCVVISLLCMCCFKITKCLFISDRSYLWSCHSKKL